MRRAGRQALASAPKFLILVNAAAGAAQKLVGQASLKGRQAMTTVKTLPSATSALNLTRCAATGATFFGLVYVTCWLLAVSGFSGASHMYLLLFGPMPIGTTSGPIAGGLCAVAAGALLGALFAILYNAFGFLARR